MLPNPVDVAKGTYGVGKGVMGWMFPVGGMNESKLELIVKGIVEKNPHIKTIMGRNPALRQQLGYAVMDTYAENQNLRRMAGYVDIADKALVPFDAVFDYMKIMGGVGYGLSAAKEIVEAVFKLPYMLYYGIKTGDIIGSIGNLLYEGLSWFVPGSLLDLTNRYADQAEKYIAKTASEKFLASVGGLESVVADAKAVPRRLDLGYQPS